MKVLVYFVNLPRKACQQHGVTHKLEGAIYYAIVLTVG